MEILIKVFLTCLNPLNILNLYKVYSPITFFVYINEKICIFLVITYSYTYKKNRIDNAICKTN